MLTSWLTEWSNDWLANWLADQLTLMRMSLESLVSQRGYVGLSVRMDRKSSSSSWPWNGDWPMSISYSSTANDHQSTELLYFWPSRIWRGKRQQRVDQSPGWKLKGGLLLLKVLDHLRGDVVGCSAEGRRPGVALHVLLAHPEVCNLDVALRVKQHVV